MGRALLQNQYFTMKKLFLILFSLSLICSCHHYSGSRGEKTQIDAEKEFRESLSSEDTSAVIALSEQFMQSLWNSRVTDAVDMIYVLYNDVVYKKSAAYTSELIQRFKMFPVLSYKMLYYNFSTEGNNDISYSYTFDKPQDGSEPSSIKLMLNPVYVDGYWFLTLKDGYQSSLDLPKEKQIHDLAPAPSKVKLNMTK